MQLEQGSGLSLQAKNFLKLMFVQPPCYPHTCEEAHIVSRLEFAAGLTLKTLGYRLRVDNSPNLTAVPTT